MVGIYVMIILIVILLIGRIFLSNRAFNPRTLTSEETLQKEIDERNNDYETF